jgi:hypothetical protein
MDEILINLAAYLKQKIIENYITQGHRLTGAFESTLEVTLKSEPVVKIIEGLGEHYAKFIDTGIPASRIPFNPGSRAGHSKYIEGLKRFAEIKFGLSGREALSRAFAIAHTQKREGMPTGGSYHYSKTGKRTEFVTDTLINEEAHIGKEIERWGGVKIDYLIDNIIRNTQK